MCRSSCFPLVVVILLSGSLSADRVQFNRDIHPVLADNCFSCHGPDSAARKADLRLDTRAGATADLGGYAAIVPFETDQSELLYRIQSDSEPMPPPESGRVLTRQEKSLLRKWIEQGAVYEKHWSFEPPQRPSIPLATGAQANGANRNPIDAFVGATLRTAGLDFSPEATPQQLIRRVTLDLTGLPPTVAETEAFVAAYRQHGDIAYEQLVDRLLSSPRYGETMTLPWLDAARFADTDGYQFDGPRYQWRWRDWVIDAYNAKMPFDQFTIEQLAGDLLPEPSLDQQIATGFNRNHRYNSEAGLVVEEFLLENAVDRVDTTATLWMGLTAGCARCHDHKFDPITQRDYYQLIAFFNSVPEAGRAIKHGNSEPVVSAPTEQQQQRLRVLKSEVARARAKLPAGFSAEVRDQLLVDRSLAHRFSLDTLPTESQPAGTPGIRNESLWLDGDSSLQINGLRKQLSFRADSTFTISFWLRADSLRNSVILSRQQANSRRPGVELAVVEGGLLRFDLITRWMAGVGRATTREKLPLDQWVHVTVTNDGSQSANGQQIFFNGRPVSTIVSHNTNSNTGGVPAARPLIVGHGVRDGAVHFRGAMRDLRLYTTDLWPEEIAVLGAVAESRTRRRFAQVNSTSQYQLYVQRRLQLESYQSTLPTVMVMKDTQPSKLTRVRERGEYHRQGATVSRDVPSSLPPMDPGLPRNRLGLAKWLVSGEHPLTARVAVNRYWQKYFGRGIVETVEDFGVQGKAPSHPRLLDWLATEFVERGWDVAHMQRLIVTSRTYRQSSRITPRLHRVDPENRLLARGARLRLTGHALRDQALYVSGLLAERVGGPSVSPYQPPDLWAEMSMGMRYKQSQGADLYRRSLYTIWKRTVAPPAMAVFDSADRETCWIKRQETNTPLQALTLLNETALVESARHLAARMLAEGKSDPVGFGFRSLTAREPNQQEREVLRKALSDYRAAFENRPQAAEQLLAVGDSPPCNNFDRIELAVYTTLANVLLNLDEAITRE